MRDNKEKWPSFFHTSGFINEKQMSYFLDN